MRYRSLRSNISGVVIGDVVDAGLLNNIFAPMIAQIPKAERLKRLHEKMIDEIQDFAIILLDVDGTVLTWNKGAETLKGYKEEEIVGQNFRVFYLPEDRYTGLPEQLLETARREGRAKYVGKRARKDGSTFWGSMILTAIHDEDDKDEVIGFTKLTREMEENELR